MLHFSLKDGLVTTLSLASRGAGRSTPVDASDVQVAYVRFGRDGEGFRLTPADAGNRNDFWERPGWYMANRIR
jgi:hypothetical protein